MARLHSGGRTVGDKVLNLRISKCGRCPHWQEGARHGSFGCTHPGSPPHNYIYGTDAPPDWCPLEDTPANQTEAGPRGGQAVPTDTETAKWRKKRIEEIRLHWLARSAIEFSARLKMHEKMGGYPRTAAMDIDFLLEPITAEPEAPRANA